MSIFDRLVSKVTDEPDQKPTPPTPYRRLLSELEQAGEDAKELYPDDSGTVDAFVASLKEVCKARRKKPPEAGQRPVKGQAQFILSEDRMCAYACLLPPENGGEELTLEEFLEDLHYEGITGGVLQDEIPEQFSQGCLRIFPVARGKHPWAGEDGKVTELFRRCGSIRLEAQGELDFRQDIQLQPIRKGAVICLIRLAKPGIDGMDVTGQPLPSPPVTEAQVPQGKNTAIGRGGRALTASVDGMLYIDHERFCIHEQKIIDGDLNQFQGTLQISGNLYIGGNVDGGVEIEASGDIVINGKVGQTRITSLNGTIRVQQGIYGTQDRTILSAARQVQALVVEHAQLKAGSNVVAEMISNSAICCGGTVYAMTGRGMIAGSTIQAREDVRCLRVGNLAGEPSRFSVGYPPGAPEDWSRMKNELTQVQATIKKLFTTIADLRRKGPRMTDGEKSVLERLVEQRDLYSQRREVLTAELSALDEVLAQKSTGRIQCAQLCPQLDVQIGRLTEAVITAEENCDIHAVGNRILLR